MPPANANPVPLSPDSSNGSPPSYRKPMHTNMAPVDPSKVSFDRSPAPSHPFDHPRLRITDPATSRALADAAALLKDEHCVVFPTETVYGLGADATSSIAVKKIYDAKMRPADNPLIVHIASLSQLRALLPPAGSAKKRKLVDGAARQREETIPEVYLPLIDAFWPGPLTILLPLPVDSPLSKLVTATQPTFAARMPDNTIAQALCILSDRPLAAPSANASGKPSPTTATHVLHDMRGRVPLILEGGACTVGLESTVVDGLRYPPAVLRPGGVSVEQIRECGGVWKDVIVHRRSDGDADGGPQAPGMKYKHYSPRAAVILYEPGAKPPTGKDLIRSVRGSGKVGVLRTRTWRPGLASEVLAMEMRGRHGEEGKVLIEEAGLGKGGEEISRGLFRRLREMDEREVDVIHVEGIEEEGEGLAVMNRLGKAAGVVVRNVG